VKKPLQLKHQRFDPDALDFYVWDHLNVVERLKNMEFRLNKTASNNHIKVYVRDVPLARGYKHERSKRPASFCRIFVNRGAESLDNTEITTWFAFGWFRRVSNRRGGLKHVLVVTPDGEFTRRYSMYEHHDLEEFVTDITGIIRALHTHEFESIQELYDFMAYWIDSMFSMRSSLSVSRYASRVQWAFAAIKKTEETRQVTRKASERMSYPRMGRPIMRQGTISYRGR